MSQFTEHPRQNNKNLTPAFGGQSDPVELIPGYLSVSVKSSKRIFIKYNFAGQITLYRDCAIQTILKPGFIPGPGSYIWILESSAFSIPSYVVLTYDISYKIHKS